MKEIDTHSFSPDLFSSTSALSKWGGGASRQLFFFFSQSGAQPNHQAVSFSLLAACLSKDSLPLWSPFFPPPFSGEVWQWSAGMILFFLNVSFPPLNTSHAQKNEYLDSAPLPPRRDVEG